MSQTPEAPLLSPERLAEIRKPYAQWMLDEASLHEIRYRSDSTNAEALHGPAKLIALDRKDLVAHLEAQRHFLAKRDFAVEQAYAAFRQQVATELQKLIYEPAVLAQLEPIDQASCMLRNNDIRRAAARLGIELPR